MIRELRKESLIPLIPAMKGYIEKVILGEESDLSPFELCISQLQEICRALINGKEFDRDISSLLISLGYEEIAPPAPSSAERKTGMEAEEALQGAEGDDLSAEDHKEEMERETTGIIIEDKGIIADFVIESIENLGTIEVKLMDLEQNPSDLETINAIFRPFHVQAIRPHGRVY